MLPRTHMVELTMTIGAATDSDCTDVVSWEHAQLCKWLVADAILSVTAWEHHNCVSGVDPRWPPKRHPPAWSLLSLDRGGRLSLIRVSILIHD